MNKLILLILAVCLVSVHAYVKRDAPEAPKPTEDLAASIQKSIQDTVKTLSEKINQDAITKGFNDAIESIRKAVDNIKPLETPKA